MEAAILQAELAYKNNEVPIGAVIVHSGSQSVLAASHNQMKEQSNPLAHAEILAINGALHTLGTSYLEECDIYVTLEPCPMCAQAIAFARLRRLYFAAYDPKSGGVEHGARIFNASSCHHTLEIYGGIKEEEAGALLQQFFRERRK